MAQPAFSNALPKDSEELSPDYQINTEFWDVTEWSALVTWLKSHPHSHTTLHCYCGNLKIADDAWDFIYSQFQIIEAAGGVVVNPKSDILLIFRKGLWDLPKGKLDEGESLADCALREVQEETGIHSLKLGDFLGSTFHIYFQDEDWILKESYWYKMYAPEQDSLKPQQEEGITEVRWVHPDHLPDFHANMYPLIADLLEKING